DRGGFCLGRGVLVVLLRRRGVRVGRGRRRLGGRPRRPPSRPAGRGPPPPRGRRRGLVLPGPGGGVRPLFPSSSIPSASTTPPTPAPAPAPVGPPSGPDAPAPPPAWLSAAAWL